MLSILRKLIGIIFVVGALVALLVEDFHFLQYPRTTLYLIIGLGILCIFYENITEFNLGILKFSLKEAKAEIEFEGEKILLKMFVRGAIADSNNQQEAESFFYSTLTGKSHEIAQSTEYFLKSLSLKKYIKYSSTGYKTNNAVDGLKDTYNVTIVKKIPL